MLGTTIKVACVSHADNDGVFYSGGHGPLWGLVEDCNSIALIKATYHAGKPDALVCHAGRSAPLKRPPTACRLFVAKVTGFENSKDDGVCHTDVVAFCVENMLKQNGGVYSCGDDWQSCTVQGGLLIAGQNPASSVQTAGNLLASLAAAEAA